MRAVGERIAIATVPLIAHLPQAFLADRNVGQDVGDLVAFVLAPANHKPVETGGDDVNCLHPINSAQWRLLGVQSRKQSLQIRRSALGVDDYSFRRVADLAKQPQLASKPKYERTKADTLHGALDKHVHAREG
jgi:hypothetical protein